MARRLVPVLAVLAAALAVVVYVVWRAADRPGTRFTIVSDVRGPLAPVVLPRTGMRFSLLPTAVGGRGRILVQVGTYLQPARDTITFNVLGVNGTRVARCVFPPSAYRDNDQLACAVPDIAAVRRLAVTRAGNAKVALSAYRGRIGLIARDEQGSLLGRASTALSRIATPLPNGVGSTVALLGLFGSVALTLLALLLGWAGTGDGVPETALPDDDGQ